MAKRLPALLLLACLALPTAARAAEPEVSLETVPPVVVQTVPRAGAVGVDPRTTEIRVTFSKQMADASWSWVMIAKSAFPETPDAPRYLKDRRTCVLPVRLAPDTTYAVWINAEKFGGFRDPQGRPAVPYLLTFRTGR